MPNELKPCPFNDLPFEERKRINYYINEARILMLRQVMSMLADSIGRYQREKLTRWKDDIEDFMRKEWEADNG